MENPADVIRSAYRILVEESRIPVDARLVSEISASGASDAPSPWPVVRAMARSLRDPHTLLLPPAVVPRMQSLVVGGSVPVPGLTVHRAFDGRCVVGEVVSGGPAARAGLAPGDVISSIDGLGVTCSFEDVVELMAKPEGSRVELRIVRGGSPAVVELTPTSWSVPLVESRPLGAGIGYVRLRFVTSSADPDRDAATLTRRALEQLGAQLGGIVLDLRSNPGGYGVTRVASVLTDRSPIALYRDLEGVEETAGRTDATAACSCPIVVLVDEQTLSSAEIITLALQDHGVARVVGQPTAGGLTVPRYVPLDEGYCLMAVDRFAIGPHTRRVPEKRRVEPDLVVPNRTPEDYLAGRDPQLEAGVALLSS